MSSYSFCAAKIAVVVLGMDVEVDEGGVEGEEEVLAGERKLLKNRPVNLIRSLRTIMLNQCKHDSTSLVEVVRTVSVQSLRWQSCSGYCLLDAFVLLCFLLSCDVNEEN